MQDGKNQLKLFNVGRDLKSNSWPLVKFLDDNSKKTSVLEFWFGEKVFDPVLGKRKKFYEFLISKKGIVSKGFTKLKNGFN